MSKFRLIALGLGSAALVIGATGCAGGITGKIGNTTGPTTTVSTKIVIGSPGVGQTLHTPFDANGTVPASITGDIVVDALDEAGATICLVDVPASTIQGGAWSVHLSGPIPPKDALVKVRAYTLAADGSPANIASADVDVSSFSTPPITIATPACHASLAAGKLEVTGTSKGVSGKAVLELRDATGKAVTKVTINTKEADTYSPWSAKLDVPASLAAGLYNLVAYQTGSDGTSVQQEFYVQVVKK
jgi:Immunoglobulin-like domain of bacterial spore germination